MNGHESGQEPDELRTGATKFVKTTIHFVRHGRVDNPQRILYGRLPGFDLSQEGVEQAQAAARLLATRSIAAVFSSPMLRARRTAQIILRHHPSLELQVFDYLNEVYGQHDGRPLDELVAEPDWQFYRDVEPLHESPADIIERVQMFMGRVRNRYLGQQVVAVTHGDIVCFVTIWARGMQVSGESKRRLVEEDGAGYPATASITSFAFGSGDELPAITYRKPY